MGLAGARMQSLAFRAAGRGARRVQFEVDISLPASVSALKVSRDALTHAGAAADLVMVAGEFVTAAILTRARDIRLRAGARAGCVRVEVTAGSGDFALHEGSLEHRVVDGLATRWDVNSGHDGKTMWAEIDDPL
jgi:hypothetical protein